MKTLLSTKNMMSLDLKNLSIGSRFPEAFEDVRKDGINLKNYPEFCNHRFLVTQAVSSNGLALRYADPSFKEDRAIVLKALHQTPLARAFIGPPLAQDKKISKIAKKEMEKFKTEHNRKELAAPAHPIGEKTFFMRRVSCYSALIKLEKEYGTDIKLLPPLPHKTSEFVRDSHVPLISGAHLIPHPIKDPFYIEHFEAILSPLLEHFVIRETEKNAFVPPHPACGKGFHDVNVDQAMIQLEDLEIPYKLAATCIEGGNCFVFLHQGTPKAIIGQLSIYLSLIALEEQGYFKNKEALLTCEGEPSLEAYRIARNLSLYHARKHTAGKSPEKFYEDADADFEYRVSLLAPVSKKEKELYAVKAKQIEGKLKLTKEKIASELEIPLEHIAFIPQREFHIDMELSVTPDGEVILHDDDKTIDFLERIKKKEALEKAEKHLLKEYITNAKDKRFQTEEVQEKAKETLKSHGFKVHLLPAVFDAPLQNSALNYCNGIFLRNPSSKEAFIKRARLATSSKEAVYVTTGPSFKEEERIHNYFIKLFEAMFPKIQVAPLPDMSSFIASTSGGIHCLTFEDTVTL